MNQKQLDQLLSEDGLSTGPRTTSDSGNSAGRKPAFVKPELICYGVVADLTSSFGGSITPTYRPNPLRANPFQHND